MWIKRRSSLANRAEQIYASCSNDFLRFYKHVPSPRMSSHARPLFLGLLDGLQDVQPATKVSYPAGRLINLIFLHNLFVDWKRFFFQHFPISHLLTVNRTQRESTRPFFQFRPIKSQVYHLNLDVISNMPSNIQHFSVINWISEKSWSSEPHQWDP